MAARHDMTNRARGTAHHVKARRSLTPMWLRTGALTLCVGVGVASSGSWIGHADGGPSSTVSSRGGSSGSPVDATMDSFQSPNLLANADAELGDPSLSGYSSVTIPGWTVTGTPTVVKYDTLRQLPSPFEKPGPILPALDGFPGTGDEPPGGGAQFFGGGPVGTSTLTQTVDLSGAASQIDTGTVRYTLTADLGGFRSDSSNSSVRVDFLGADHQALSSAEIGPVTASDRSSRTRLLARDTSATIPLDARSARVVVTLTDLNVTTGNDNAKDFDQLVADDNDAAELNALIKDYNNAYADDVSFTVGADLPAAPPPAPPVSTVKPLDHVFLVYMENKGVNDIVGSPNAPYTNELLSSFGHATNYYALTHPSDPNYTPILGGSDFGISYNCPADCISAPNLADNVEAAGKTWAGYVKGMPAPGTLVSGLGYASDSLPFLAYRDIYDDPGRAKAHLFPLTQMLPDAAGSATAPNFTWFAADGADDMEGPQSGSSFDQFRQGQLTDQQYNVKAGDEFLRQQLTGIMNSAVWQDPTQRSAIFLTWDEDNNNLSLGIGNQGNRVVTIVIPSPGAVASGMRGGPFAADDYYNHYSLQRTIEDALGLPPVTRNDSYARPMNQFWIP